ncbi:MAG: LCP family protein [Frankia sp.]
MVQERRGPGPAGYPGPRGRGAPLPPDFDPRRGAARRPPPRREPPPPVVSAATFSQWPALRAVLSGLSALVLLVSVGGWVSYSYFNGKIAHVALNLNGNRPDSAAGGTQNYLLVGTDSRAGTGTQYGVVEGERSDSTMLVHLDKNGTTTMVSFPRDLLVTIPAYTSSKGTHYAETKAKFNSAIQNGGPGRLVSLVESLTDIRVDHYVSIDLAGFKAMTNAIGGVDVCVLPSTHREVFVDNGITKVSTNTNDPMSGFVGGPGTIHVNGDQGLAFVRQRHGLPNGDIDRIKRQQQFLGAVFRKATTGGVLANPLKLEGLVSSATSALTLDDNTNINDLKKLATRLRGVAAGSVHMETVPNHVPSTAEGATDSAGNIPPYGDVLVIDQTAFEQMLASLRGQSGSSSTATKAPTVAPSSVSVVVYNGSRRAGLASTTVAELTAKGFVATSGGNASTTTYVTTRVRYGAGQQAQAQTLLNALPGARLESDPSISGVQLILGSSFAGVGVASATSGGTTSGGTTAAGATAVVPSATASTAPAVTAAPGACTY